MVRTLHNLIIFFTLVVPAFVSAEELGAHTHGEATLTAVLENNTLEIHFESPAFNILGFEHKARSSEDKNAVHSAKVSLESASSLFSFTGTTCNIEKTEIDFSMVVSGNEHHHKHKEHKEHNSDNHSEIHANYLFDCRDAKKLKSISPALFKHFPRIEKIHAMWVTESKQGSALLVPGGSISLR